MPTNGPSLIVFALLAAFTLATAVGAMALRNLVHCGLSLALSFAGLAALYLHLNAEFAGFAQILVYVGAVAILIVFTILLTKNTDVHLSRASKGWAAGLAIAVVVGACIAGPLLKSPSLNRPPPAVPEHSVRRIGEQLMTVYVLPLQAVGLLLTAALLGGVVIAMRDEPHENVKPRVEPPRSAPEAVTASRFDTSALEHKP